MVCILRCRETHWPPYCAGILVRVSAVHVFLGQPARDLVLVAIVAPRPAQPHMQHGVTIRPFSGGTDVF